MNVFKIYFCGCKYGKQKGVQSNCRRLKNDIGEGRVKSTPNGMVQTPCFSKNKNFKNRKRKNKNLTQKKIFEKRKCVKVIVFVLSHPEISIFVSCVMVCDVIRFVLRHFLGFLVGFYVLCGKLFVLC